MSRPPLRLSAALAVLVLAPFAVASSPVETVLVSRLDEPAMQAQAPVWAPADAGGPRLTYEVNDRDRRIHLRIARRGVDGWSVQDVPLLPGESAGAFLMSDERVDSGVCWDGDGGFYFTRIHADTSKLYHFDAGPQLIPLSLEGVADPAVAPGGEFLALVSHTAQGGDLHLAPPGRWDQDRSLTRTPRVVEHGPAWCPDGETLLHVATDRERTTLHLLRVRRTGAPARRTLLASDDEVLSVACRPGTGTPIAAAQVRAASGGHSLLGIDMEGNEQFRVDGVHVQPGPPPRPAWSPGGRYLLFVADDESMGNPLRALDTRQGRILDLPLETSRHLEVSTGGWIEEGESRIGAAVVAVGELGGANVRNHVYVADLTGLLVDDR